MKDRFKNWSKLDFIWLAIANLVILGLGIYWGDSPMSLISSVTGVTCVIFISKQMIENYYVGAINALLYGLLAYQSHLYGDAMLNLLYYLPMQFVGYFAWKKAGNNNANETIAKRLSGKQRTYGALICIALIYTYSMFLELLGGNIPLIDATSTVLSVVAMFLQVKMYMEQWYLWVLVNIVSVTMWVVTLNQGSGDVATLIMWIIFLVNSIFGLINWTKASK